MPPLTDLLGHSAAGDLLLAVCLSIVGLSVVGVGLLLRPPAKRPAPVVDIATGEQVQR